MYAALGERVVAEADGAFRAIHSQGVHLLRILLSVAPHRRCWLVGTPPRPVQLYQPVRTLGEATSLHEML